MCQVLLYHFSDLSLAGQLGLGCVTAAAAPPYAVQTAVSPAAAAGVGVAAASSATPLVAAAAAQAAAPGKARSSMNLGMISGR